MRDLVPLIGLPLKAELAQQIFLTWDIGKCSGVWSILYHVETNSWISHISAQSMFEVPIRKLLFFTFHIWHNPEAHDLKQSVRSQERAIVIKWRCYGYLHNKPAYPCTSTQYHQLVDLQHLLIPHHKWNQANLLGKHFCSGTSASPSPMTSEPSCVLWKDEIRPFFISHVSVQLIVKVIS